MKVDKDLNKLMRYGKSVSRMNYRKEIESGVVVGICTLLLVFFFAATLIVNK